MGLPGNSNATPSRFDPTDRWTRLADRASIQKKEAWTLLLVLFITFLTLHFMTMSFGTSSICPWLTWGGVGAVGLAFAYLCFTCLVTPDYWARKDAEEREQDEGTNMNAPG
jgi:protein-S-isoprenylcysteine O-methyltransferase Ste14